MLKISLIINNATNVYKVNIIFVKNVVFLQLELTAETHPVGGLTLNCVLTYM
jgi:hypothetical protein